MSDFDSLTSCPLCYVLFLYTHKAAEGEAAADQSTGEAVVTSESAGDGEEVKESVQEGGQGEVEGKAEGEGEGPAVDPLAAEMSEEVEEKNEDITDSTPSTSKEADSEVGIL